MKRSIPSLYQILHVLAILNVIFFFIILIQEVYCANEEKDNGPSNKNEQLMHHMDKSLEFFKDMLKELRLEVKDIAKQVVRNGPKRSPVTNDVQNQKESKEWRNKQDKQAKELKELIIQLDKKVKQLTTFITHRGSSFSSKGEECDSDHLELPGTLKKLKKKKKKGDILERSISEGSASEKKRAVTPTGKKKKPPKE